MYNYDSTELKPLICVAHLADKFERWRGCVHKIWSYALKFCSDEA